MSHDHSGMDMGDESTSGSMAHGMKMYFHGTLSDTLWFSSWTPTSAGGFAAACIALFFLAVVDRFLAAVRASAEVRWRASVAAILLPSSVAHPRPRPAARSSSSSDESSASASRALEKDANTSSGAQATAGASTDNVPTLASASPSSPPQPSINSSDPLPTVMDLLPGRRARWAPPFVWRIDVVRGAMQAVQLGVHYALMLAVMTFNVYFFLVILIGAGVGETLFGRFSSGGGH